jgi:3-dehydroquinate dehydratase
VSVIAEVCEGQIAGRGAGSYLEALERLARPRP